MVGSDFRKIPVTRGTTHPTERAGRRQYRHDRLSGRSTRVLNGRLRRGYDRKLLLVARYINLSIVVPRGTIAVTMSSGRALKGNHPVRRSRAAERSCPSASMHSDPALIKSQASS